MKKIITIIFTLGFVLFFTSKIYGQGWERLIPYNYSYTTGNFNSDQDFCATNDGGVITTDYFKVHDVSYRGLYLNRFDKSGNLIWNMKRIIQTPCDESECYIDSLGGPSTSIIQLNNNNIVLTFPREYSTLLLIDNYGNYIKKQILRNDSLMSSSYYGSQPIIKLYYVEERNEIEHITIKAIAADTIIFKKSVFDINLQLKNTIHNRIFSPNIGTLSNIYDLTPYKSTQNGYLWYSGNDGFGNDGYGIGISDSMYSLLKINNNGDLVYFKSPITTSIIFNKLQTTAPSDYIVNMFSTRAQQGIDISENINGCISFCINIYCAYYNPTDGTNSFKTYHLIHTIDSLGAIVNTNIINSLVDTFGAINNYYLNFNHNFGESILSKYLNLDTLLMIKINTTILTQFNSIWEVIKLNVRNGNVFYQKLFNPLGYNGYYQKYTSNNLIKKYSKDNSSMYVGLIYTKNGLDLDGIAKIDNNGLPFGNTILGNVFNDTSNNCIKNTTEKGVPNYTVTVTKNNFNIFGTTDRNGDYLIGLADSGNYTVSIRPNIMFPLWNAVCNPTQNITVENTIAYDTVNFALKPTLLCPYNTVNVSTTTRFRIGRTQTYTVNYCNNGTILSPNTYITIKLDTLLDFNSSTIPYTTLPNYTYRFNIGNLDYLTCGSFSFVATPRIGVVQLNQTLCAEAHIYPDTICTTPNYTGAFIEANARCLGDSVQFNLQNTGSGNMTAPKKYIVIEGNVMRINQNYQLNANEILTETLAADSGKTYRIIAEQPDNLPTDYGDRFATAAVENCQPITNFSTGFFTQFPNYDGEPYRAVSCNVITGAYDPNDKVASPVGYATPHYIEANTQIDYQINFQNTGNDTAFKVVVVDTISPTLDINTIQLGVASHPYQFQRTDSNVVQFVFDSIFLVDSFRNEPKSHGFVKFKIQQKPNNPVGTKIYNKADIYFDYNAPITTNQTYHTIGRNYISVDLITSTISTKYNVKTMKVFPNPFREKTQIIVDGDELKNSVLILMNMEGKIIKSITSNTNNTFDVYREDLSNGTYLFNIIVQNEIIATGKLLVQ